MNSALESLDFFSEIFILKLLTKGILSCTVYKEHESNDFKILLCEFLESEVVERFCCS